MPKVWPYATIRELLALAEASGESKAMLASEREAELFRYAIYSFRKASGEYNDLSATIDNTTVVVRKRVEPSVKIVHEAASP